MELDRTGRKFRCGTIAVLIATTAIVVPAFRVRADVLPPRTDCPEGARGATFGDYCIVSSPCESDAGTGCLPVKFCTETIERVVCSNPGCNESVNGYCPESGDCAIGTCNTFYVYVREDLIPVYAIDRNIGSEPIPDAGSPDATTEPREDIDASGSSGTETAEDKEESSPSTDVVSSKVTTEPTEDNDASDSSGTETAEDNEICSSSGNGCEVALRPSIGASGKASCLFLLALIALRFRRL